MAQRVTIAASTATSTVLTPSNTEIGWRPVDYMDHWISWSDLGSAVATVRIYNAAGAAESEYTIYGTPTTPETRTGDNQGIFFPYDTYGPIYGFVVTYATATFTGNVFFSSLRPSVGIV